METSFEKHSAECVTCSDEFAGVCTEGIRLINAAQPSVAPTAESKRQSVECKLTADEKQLFQAVLRVIDDGNTDGPWALHVGDARDWTQEHVDRERLDFADAIINTFRRFKAQQ